MKRHLPTLFALALGALGGYVLAYGWAIPGM